MFFQCLNSSEMLFYHYGDPMSIYILQVIEWPGENQYSFDVSQKLTKQYFLVLQRLANIFYFILRFYYQLSFKPTCQSNNKYVSKNLSGHSPDSILEEDENGKKVCIRSFEAYLFIFHYKMQGLHYIKYCRIIAGGQKSCSIGKKN